MIRTGRTPIQSLALAALLTCTFGCNGQVPPMEGKPTLSAAAAPLDQGLYNYLSGKSTPIQYDLDSRFLLTATKAQLQQARTIHDLVPGHLEQQGATYTTVSVRTLGPDGETEQVAHGQGAVLDAAQKKLLGSLGYSDSFMIDARSTTNTPTGGTTSTYQTPHVTVVPEHQAHNSVGRDALVAHVRNATAAFAYVVDAKNLRAGKIHFTVDKAGTLTRVGLTSSSGYPLLDKQVLELVNDLPGTWQAATNAAGEAVEQEFVFSFGVVGC